MKRKAGIKQLKILMGHFQNRRFIEAEILAKSLTEEFKRTSSRLYEMTIVKPD